MTTEQKHEIEIPCLPEGWRAVAYRLPKLGEHILNNAWSIEKADHNFTKLRFLVVEKIKPHRVVLEKTEEKHLGFQTLYIDDTEFMIMTDKVWREVKETDIPLINEDANVKMGVSQGDGGYYPTLELNVKELRNVRSLIKDFENLGWFINPERALLLQKITEFIKDK